jgi:hypothetical protein
MILERAGKLEDRAILGIKRKQKSFRMLMVAAGRRHRHTLA